VKPTAMALEECGTWPNSSPANGSNGRPSDRPEPKDQLLERPISLWLRRQTRPARHVPWYRPIKPDLPGIMWQMPPMSASRPERSWTTADRTSAGSFFRAFRPVKRSRKIGVARSSDARDTQAQALIAAVGAPLAFNSVADPVYAPGLHAFNAASIGHCDTSSRDAFITGKERTKAVHRFR